VRCFLYVGTGGASRTEVEPLGCAPMRVLVTGAAGFIGSAICRRLVPDGHDVVGLDDLSVGTAEQLAGLPEVRLEVADLRDRDAVVRAAKGCDAILHQAAMKSVPRSIEEPERYTDVNVLGTLNVLEAAREGSATLVFASSSSVYGDQDRFPQTEDMAPRPRSPYAATKLAGEGYCRAWWESYGVPTIALRYYNVYGPGQDPASEYAAVVTRFITACLTGARPTIYGDGEQSRDFAFVDDVAEANLLAARAPEEAFGRAFNIGGGAAPTSVNRLLQMIGAACGVEPRPVREPERPGDIRRSEADVALARDVLGIEPTVGIEEGLRRTVDWFRVGRRPPERLL
jgi:nucleoside-diphosphate-sugar epimerase